MISYSLVSTKRKRLRRITVKQHVVLVVVQSNLSEHSKCQAYVVSCGRWSLTRAQTITGQNTPEQIFFSLYLASAET